MRWKFWLIGVAILSVMGGVAIAASVLFGWDKVARGDDPRRLCDSPLHRSGLF